MTRGNKQSASPDPNEWVYAYDDLGNRRSYVTDDAVATAYTSNALNQYHRSQLAVTPPVAQGYRYDADGNLIELYTTADMNCDGQVGFPDVNCFVQAITANYCAGQPEPANDYCPDWPDNHACGGRRAYARDHGRPIAQRPGDKAALRAPRLSSEQTAHCGSTG